MPGRCCRFLGGALASGGGSASADAESALACFHQAPAVESFVAGAGSASPLSKPAAVAAIYAGDLDGTMAGLTFKKPDLQRQWELDDVAGHEAFSSQQVVGMLCAGALQPQVRCRPVGKNSRSGQWYADAEWLPDVVADLQ